MSSLFTKHRTKKHEQNQKKKTGKGEPIRYAMAVKGVKWQEVTLDLGADFVNMKAKAGGDEFPFGQAPK
jgi:hypothetical protein